MQLRDTVLSTRELASCLAHVVTDRGEISFVEVEFVYSSLPIVMTDFSCALLLRPSQDVLVHLVDRFRKLFGRYQLR